jgi:hypothetical protein
MNYFRDLDKGRNACKVGSSLLGSSPESVVYKKDRITAEENRNVCRR